MLIESYKMFRHVQCVGGISDGNYKYRFFKLLKIYFRMIINLILHKGIILGKQKLYFKRFCNISFKNRWFWCKPNNIYIMIGLVDLDKNVLYVKNFRYKITKQMPILLKNLQKQMLSFRALLDDSKICISSNEAEFRVIDSHLLVRYQFLNVFCNGLPQKFHAGLNTIHKPSELSRINLIVRSSQD